MRLTMRKSVLLTSITALAVLVALPATGVGGVKNAGKANAGITIGYATKSATNQGWIIINQGAKDAAKKAGVKLILLGPPIENDIGGQLNVVEDLISRGVDGLAIAPVDSTGIVPVVKKANAKKIPVIAIDTKIEGGKVTSFVATNNLLAASIQARAVGKAIGGKGKVVLINGNQAQQTGRERRTGFLSTMKKEFPGVKVLEVQTKWDPTTAANGLQDLLGANSDIKAVANAWDGATVADIPVLKSKGLVGKVFLIGFDGAPDAIAQMQKGAVQADVAQQLYQIGFQGITATIKAAKGQKVSPRIDTGAKLLTPSNLAAFIASNPPVLHDFIKKAGGK